MLRPVCTLCLDFAVREDCKGEDQKWIRIRFFSGTNFFNIKPFQSPIRASKIYGKCLNKKKQSVPSWLWRKKIVWIHFSLVSRVVSFDNSLLTFFGFWIRLTFVTISVVYSTWLWFSRFSVLPKFTSHFSFPSAYDLRIRISKYTPCKRWRVAEINLEYQSRKFEDKKHNLHTVRKKKNQSTKPTWKIRTSFCACGKFWKFLPPSWSWNQSQSDYD